MLYGFLHTKIPLLHCMQFISLLIFWAGSMSELGSNSFSAANFVMFDLLVALLWLLASACSMTGRLQIAKRAIELAEQRLSKDGWPEYYDGKTGKYIGKQARKFQTWSMSGYLIAKTMTENPNNVSLLSIEGGVSRSTSENHSGIRYK